MQTHLGAALFLLLNGLSERLLLDFLAQKP